MIARGGFVSGTTQLRRRKRDKGGALADSQVFSRKAWLRTAGDGMKLIRFWT